MWYTKELAVLCEGPSVVRQGPTLLETESDSIFFPSDPPHWESDAMKKIKIQLDAINVFKNQF